MTKSGFLFLFFFNCKVGQQDESLHTLEWGWVWWWDPSYKQLLPDNAIVRRS